MNVQPEAHASSGKGRHAMAKCIWVLANSCRKTRP